MAVLVYNSGETTQLATPSYGSGEKYLDAHHLALGVQIGTTEQADLRVREGFGVEPLHAVLIRSLLYKVHLIVDVACSEGGLRVNGQPVARLKTLHHRDQIAIARFQMTFWELVIRTVTHGSPLKGKVCQVCFDAIGVGQEAVRCPRCDSPHHRGCWFYLRNCSLEACGYPVQETMCQLLSPPARFEVVAETSLIVREKKTCPAGTPRDIAPFRPDEQVAYCPACETVFHTECWFALPRCPKCSYDVGALLNRVFVSAAPSQRGKP